MDILRARRVLLCCFFAFLAIAARPAEAQTWQWPVVVQTAGATQVNAQSRLVLSAGAVALSYAAQIRGQEVPIVACHAAFGDIADAQAVRRAGRAFLLLHFKPQHPATCNSGVQSVAMLPVADGSDLTRAVATINRNCCAAAVAVRTPPPARSPSPVASPIASPAASPVASPAASPSSGASLRLTDWVENDGAFSFVRLRNRLRQPVNVSGVEIGNCRDVDYGCGEFPNVTLDPGSVGTIATVLSHGSGSAFTYRYVIERGSARATATGSSGTVPVGWRPRMSAQEIRAAEVAAFAARRERDAAADTPATTQTPVPAFVNARLAQRGSSRLGIGQTGTALVRVSVAASGMPEQASIVSISNRKLAAAAIETAISSSYTPAMRNGRPVAGTYVATFQFDGEDPALAGIPVWKRQLPSPTPSP
jgi:Gram-negative bacterial TonB protein C-terminal